MGNTKKWVIATNGTKYASAAVKYAAELFRDLRAEPEVYILVVAVDDESITEAKAITEMAKYSFEDIAGKEGSLTMMVETGEPGKVIIDQVNKLKADHLFIGGADFKWDINDDSPGGISNYLIEHISGGVTLIK
ncbi:MAG: universal stress protein [Gracilimonas sp.]|uniref:universal stress protein n=1 Tax=Gracilimonas sp. TaxID=1974203 RepID=UPI001997BD46|nr:universal stress protein [Gracilimonas sp.]MBD3617196.1 universal stress protein [Gracilimonas sp.]